MKVSNTPLASLWEKLVQPAASLVSARERRQARFLSSLIVLTVLLAIMTNILIYVYDSDYLTTTFPIVAPALALFLMAYALSRTKRYRSGAILTIIAFSGAALFSGQINPAYHIIGPISITFSLILAAVFFPLPGVITIGTLNWIVLIVVLYLIPQETDYTENFAAVLWVAVMTVILVLWLGYRNAIERERRAEQVQLEIFKEKSAFVHQVIDALSHDLKTPLSVINTSLYLLERLHDPD